MDDRHDKRATHRNLVADTVGGAAVLRGLLDRLVESAPIGIALLDADLRFVLVNRALADINGVSPEDHVGRSIRQVVPGIADTVEGLFRSVLETGQPLLGLELVGETAASPGRPRSWSEDVYRLEADGVVLGVAALVTETTEELRGEGRVGRVIDALGSFVGLLDLDGVLVGANEHALEAAGLEADDVIGRPFWETYWWSLDGETQAQLRDGIGRAALGERVRYDADIQVASGRVVTIDFQLFPLIEDGAITGLVSSGVDISARRAAVQRMRSLGRFSEALAVAENTDDVASAILAYLPAALDADFANLAVMDDETSSVVFVHPLSLPAGIAQRYGSLGLYARTPLTDAVRERRRVVLHDLDEYQHRYPDLVGDTVASGLAATASIPLVSVEGVMGAVGVGWAQPLDGDDALDARFQVVADLTSQALRRSRTADQRAQLIDQLRSHLVSAPIDHPHLDVAVRYQAAGHNIGFGGDWYDVISLDHGRVAVVVGDVVGHGIDAAAHMGVLRTVLNTVIRLGTPLAEIFDAAEPLIADLGEVFLGTALVVVLDPATGQMAYSSAGHPPLLMVRPGEHPVVLEDGTRPVLGLGAHAAMEGSEGFWPGTVLVAYTDGLVESRREHFDLAVARVAQELEHVATESASSEDIADALLATAGDAAALKDDVALVVVRFSGG